jgi:hypothetical protein
MLEVSAVLPSFARFPIKAGAGFLPWSYESLSLKV